MVNIPMPAQVVKPAAAASSSTVAELPKDFNKAQAKKAVNALLAHHAKDKERQEEKTLISKDEHVWLMINTRKMPTKHSLKPSRINLPNPPLPPPPATSVCLFTKNPQRYWKDELHKQGVKFIARVVGLEKLKGKHKPFEARRALAADHQVFLCDEAIMPSMPKLLGKIFFDSKKQPLPVNLKKKDIKTELAQAISSAFFHESRGTASSLRIATALHHTPEQVLANLLAAIPAVVGKIPDGWENIKSIGIKTSGSMLLPVWTVDPSKLYGSDDVDIKVRSKSDRKRLRGEESDDSMMTASEDETASTPKKQKKAEKVSKTTEAAVPEKAAPSPKKAAPSPKKAAPSPKKAATAPAVEKAVPEVKEKEPKKVLAGKSKDAVAPKKKVAGAASLKSGVVGKKRK